MIRRDAAADSTSTSWILISQIDHARLAWQLAEHWGANNFAPLVPRDELLWAIDHHDDGWRAWEQAPGVDAERGRPLSFTELSLADSVAIWTGSIDEARAAGHLQAYVVAGHFCALTRRSAAWRCRDPLWPRAEQFLARYEALMVTWLAAWQVADPAANTPAVAARALAQLQFFDALSLWFCCSPASEPETIETPGGPVLTLCPQGPAQIGLTPWPITVAELNLEIPARSVPLSRYQNPADLAAAPSQPVRLRWQLRPDAQKS